MNVNGITGLRGEIQETLTVDVDGLHDLGTPSKRLGTVYCANLIGSISDPDVEVDNLRFPSSAPYQAHVRSTAPDTLLFSNNTGGNLRLVNVGTFVSNTVESTTIDNPTNTVAANKIRNTMYSYPTPTAIPTDGDLLGFNGTLGQMVWTQRAGPTGGLGPTGPTGATGAASTVPGPTGPTGPVGPTGSNIDAVLGPTASTDNAVVRFDGATGKLVQNSGVIVDDSNNVSGLANISTTTGLIQTSTTDTPLILEPNGVGPIQARSSGNGRGDNSIDLQRTGTATTVASGASSTIGGGSGNTTTGSWSTIAGGRNNTASFSDSFVGGGNGNTASGQCATVCGGDTNNNTGLFSFVGAGRTNTLSGNASFMGALENCTLASANSAILAGANHTINSPANYSTVLGGRFVTLSSPYTLGWNGNSSGSVASSTTNQLIFNVGASAYTPPATSGYYLVGGNATFSNNIEAAAYTSASGVDLILAAGGAAGIKATTTGDTRGTFSLDLQRQRLTTDQVASGSYAVVLNGQRNRAAHTYSTVLNGFNNTVFPNSTYGTIINGVDNNLTGSHFIGVGNNNTINNATGFSFIGAGTANVITGARNFIGVGVGHTIANTDCSVFGNNPVITTADGQFIINSSAASFTPAAAAGFFLNGDARIYNGDLIFPTAGNGLFLPTTGGTATRLDYYEETTHDTRWVIPGGTFTASQTFNIVRNGKMVVLNIPIFTATPTANGAFVIETAIPTRFRPARESAFVIQVRNGTPAAFGVCILATTGIITFYAGPSGTNVFTSGTLSGLYTSATLTYQLS